NDAHGGSSPPSCEKNRPVRGAPFFLLPPADGWPAASPCPVKASSPVNRAGPGDWWWSRAWAGESADSAGYSAASYDPRASCWYTGPLRPLKDALQNRASACECLCPFQRRLSAWLGCRL